MGRGIIKKLWDIAPVNLRNLICTSIGRVSAKKRYTCTVPSGIRPFFICGALKSVCGVGEGARLYAHELEQQGNEVIRVDITRQMRMSSNMEILDRYLQREDLKKWTGTGTVVIHANPPQFYLVLAALGRKFLQNKHIVGYWAWEKERIPGYWLPAFDYIDSIETPSNFVANVFTQHTNKPIKVHPHFLPKSNVYKKNYATDGKLHCLFVFDMGSSLERKNPIGVLEAFRQAFSPNEAELTFKVINTDFFSEQFKNFKKACSKVPGVHIISTLYNKKEMEKLYLDHDIYISLHGSEGFGLTIKEALNYGLYVVATGYGGNVDFMQGEKSFFIKTKKTKDGYAEPNIADVVNVLRELGMRLLKNSVLNT